MPHPEKSMRDEASTSITAAVFEIRSAFITMPPLRSRIEPLNYITKKAFKLTKAIKDYKIIKHFCWHLSTKYNYGEVA